ncbi:polysaccharide biosynthesis/export family protein [Gemmata sp. JC717]|uniref:Polysaccharide biosynthesis/export family protein n=1 Tax=Gemmata algarum TaxID=2975278 RepID=A0ABU5EVJ8_9BACT|nr:polysaccharide biosynthesis/export family protein [Gemmata algarum]MDY3551869.1 polysaccharide biosynthesis/export family protein [Gemmata algarum]MDY3557833.1 polysaccharide biosynthesis/export family protein [Gemmata algarum]
MTTTRALLFLLVVGTSGGCASLTNPVADGVPVNRLPAEVLGRPKSELRPLPLTLLRQAAPAEYTLDAGDVLAITANEIFAPGDQLPPVRPADASGRPPVVGYPVTVRDDGTLSLPLLKPLNVRGKTIRDVERMLLDAVTGKNGGPEIVKPGAARVSVQMYQRRQYQVLVVRQDSASGTSGRPLGGPGLANPFSNVGALGGEGKRGLGFTVNLPAGENDVLRALNATGGLPGSDAKNEIVIIRGGRDFCAGTDPAAQLVRIPLRVYPDQQLVIRAEDVILHEGDVVVIESRETEVFYTSGIMGSFVVPLPRDHDLDVIQAIAFVRGPLLNGSFSQTAFSASSVNNGIGNPSASLCSVLRQLPDRRQITIRVDLNKAFRDPRERILIQSGDVLVLQEAPGESLTRYFTQTFRLSGVFNILRRSDASSVITTTVP